MENRLLVAFDGSNCSLEALKEAVQLAQTFHCEITVINVQPSFHTIHTSLLFKEKQIKEFQKELFYDVIRSAEQLLKRTHLEYEIILKIGDPIKQICQVAKEKNVKFIVMGSRGMGLVKGTVLGSVSYGVIHQSETPVLIFPQKCKMARLSS